VNKHKDDSCRPKENVILNYTAKKNFFPNTSTKGIENNVMPLGINFFHDTLHELVEFSVRENFDKQ
jgi:hypothetical protein